MTVFHGIVGVLKKIAFGSFSNSSPADGDAWYDGGFKFREGGATKTLSTGAGDMLAANNLSDVADAAAARTNLGLGSAATKDIILTRLASDHAISSTTATKVSLGATLGAGTYMFQYSLLARSATATVSPMFGVNFTGTATEKSFRLRYPDTGTTAMQGTADDNGSTGGQIEGSVASNTYSTTAPNLGATGGVATTDANILYVIEGVMVVTVTGDLELWHGSETNTSTTVKAGSSLMVLRCDSADPVSARTQYAIAKTADEGVISSTTLQDDNVFSFPIGANETWVFHLNMRVHVPAGGGGFKKGFAYPSGCAGRWSEFLSVTGNNSNIIDADISATNGHRLQMDISGTMAWNSVCNIWGYVVNGSTAGTIQFRWAQNVSVASTTSVKRGSTMIATRVA